MADTYKDNRDKWRKNGNFRKKQNKKQKGFKHVRPSNDDGNENSQIPWDNYLYDSN